MDDSTTLAAHSASGVHTVAPGAAFPRRVWERWRKAAHAIGVVQTRGIMVIMYVLMVLPMGFLFRLAGDPLHLRPPKNGNWHECRQSPRTIDAARRQF